MGVKRSKIVIPFHLVWTTKNREGWITPEIEEQIHRALFAKAGALKAKVLAIGGMPDTVAALVKQLKGASQNLASEALLRRTVFWQEGYGAFAFQINARHRVITYIQNQKERHAQNTLRPTLETTDEEIPG
ncbi:transposase [Armatimonas sp.]|uniref:transposase n=1 Tax=Armatimonas sp. TaxID=1872638 RepID=UPI00374D3BAA